MPIASPTTPLHTDTPRRDLRAAKCQRSHHACSARLLHIYAIFLLGTLQACSTLLPKSHNESTTFPTFYSARDSIESLVPLQSTVETLQALRIDPAHQSNITILSYPDLLRRFSPGGVDPKDHLESGIAMCLTAQDACRGWEISISSISKARTGSFFLDFMNFRRRTEITGWRFNALILIANEVVVYRSWGGQPQVTEIEVNRNPLGPLQDIGPSMLR